MAKITLIDDVESDTEEWRVLYEMINLCEKEVFRRMGKFEDRNAVSLKVVQELISSAKHICEKQWKGLNILYKLQSMGVIKLQ